MYPAGGYYIVTPRQLAAVVGPFVAGELSLRAVRVFFAALELRAIRDAARRSRPGRGAKCRFRVDELARLVGDLDEPAVRRELRRLKRAAVLDFAPDAITIGEPAGEEGSEYAEALACKRSPRRPIPVPRPMLRFLAACTKRSVMLTAIGYLVRGLSLERGSGVVKGRGSVKLSWVTRVFSLSERAAHYARAELIRLGWIGKDSGSTQRKLNWHGAYFQLNLGWRRPGDAVEKDGSGRASVVVPAARVAPLTVRNGAPFAPPERRPLNYFVVKNQKAAGAPARPAGVSTKRTGDEQPTLRDVKRVDLENFSRTEALYEQAVKVGLVNRSEASFLAWVAAAVRARSVESRDPVRVFVGIVRKKLWGHVTQAEEERARAAIVRYRFGAGPVQGGVTLARGVAQLSKGRADLPVANPQR